LSAIAVILPNISPFWGWQGFEDYFFGKNLTTAIDYQTKFFIQFYFIASRPNGVTLKEVFFAEFACKI
jgi:hypothetical protein